MAIEGGYEPYAPTPAAPASTSPDAAIATAAYDTLTGLQPQLGANQTILDSDYAAYLAAIPDGQAKADGITVGALTNDLRAFHGDGAMSSHPLLSTLDVLVDGSDTGVLKPDPRAYAIAVDRLGRPPEEIVFVDDMPWNIAPARRAGMIALELDLSDPGEVFSRARTELGLAPAELRALREEGAL